MAPTSFARQAEENSGILPIRLRSGQDDDARRLNNRWNVNGNYNYNGEIQGSLHCAMDDKPSIASVEMTLFARDSRGGAVRGMIVVALFVGSR